MTRKPTAEQAGVEKEVLGDPVQARLTIDGSPQQDHPRSDEVTEEVTTGGFRLRVGAACNGSMEAGAFSVMQPQTSRTPSAPRHGNDRLHGDATAPQIA